MIRYLFLFIIIGSFFSCSKANKCETAIVTLKSNSCKKVGLIINGTMYPSDDLPDQYAIEGKEVCLHYSFWNDPRVCPCCGGKKVHVIDVQ